MSPCVLPVKQCFVARLAIACLTLCLALAAFACDSGDGEEALGTSSPSHTPSTPPEPSATSTAVPEISRAERLAYEGEYEAAITEYAAVAGSSTGSEQQQARFRQAQLLNRAGRDSEARPILATFLADAGIIGDAHVARFMYAEALADTGDATGALASYQRHIDAGGALQAYARGEQALLLAGAGRADEARLAAEAAAAAAPRAGYFATFALRLADAFAAAGADADALAWYSRARAEGGDAVAALARAGAIKRRTGDPTWVDDYVAVIAGFPQSGAASTLLDELDAAGVPVSDYLRGVVEYRSRRDGAARISLARARDAGDHPAEATYYLAAIDERAGALDAAIEGYGQAFSLDATSPLADNALWWRGRLLEGLGRYDEASATFAQLVAAYPASEWAGDARFHSGMALYRAGDRAAAAYAWAAMLNAGASEEDRAKLLFWRGRAEMDADVPNATGALGALVAEHAGTFYALRAEVLLENNETSHPQPDLSPPPVDWNAIADYMFAEQGIDPRIVPAGTTEDQRWTIGAALEDAGLHDESVAVYLDMLFDKRLPGGPDVLFRATRRLAEEGRTSLAARAATALIAALESAPGTRAPDDLYRVAYPLAYGDLAAMAADDEDVSPLLLLSLVRQESFYDPLAGSSAGALGLTQVIEPTGRSIASVLGIDGFAVTDLYRPKLSLRFGANYISDQLDQFDGNVYHALAAYNGGPGTASNAIDTAGDDIDLFVEDLEFDETKLYVKLVMENYARYRQLYAGLDRPSLPD